MRKYGLKYQQRLESLSLLSLENRRKIQTLYLIFNIKKSLQSMDKCDEVYK